MFATIKLELSGHVAVLTLNRPDARNALSAELKRELAEALDRIELDADCRTLIITGAGDKAFCAGADLKERAATDPSPPEFVESQRRTVELFSRIAALPFVTIAALNGVAAGGGAEIALCCDFRLAAEHARIGLTEINLGVIPAGGGTQRLSRLVGLSKAKQLVFTGALLDARLARDVGLVDEVCAPDTLMTRAWELAGSIAEKSPLAIRVAKQVLEKGFAAELDAGLELELQGAAILFASDDRKEGIRAFLEKRKPNFTGR